VADTRECEQCGSVFAPRREHARFCGARCRVAWNREHARDRSAGLSALDWSIAAMADATGRLARGRASDLPRGLAAISEAVWWVTIVDATLVRYHPDTYDEVLAAQLPAEGKLIEDILGGLRFVRNRMGQYLDPADFICPLALKGARAGSADPDSPAGVSGPARPGEDSITCWTWKALPEPALDSLPPRGQAWEMARYRAYQATLAGNPVGEVFDRAAAFLRLAAAQAAGAASAVTPAGR
jgi:hypothetical protein